MVVCVMVSSKVHEKAGLRPHGLHDGNTVLRNTLTAAHCLQRKRGSHWPKHARRTAAHQCISFSTPQSYVQWLDYTAGAPRSIPPIMLHPQRHCHRHRVRSSRLAALLTSLQACLLVLQYKSICCVVWGPVLPAALMNTVCQGLRQWAVYMRYWTATKFSACRSRTEGIPSRAAVRQPWLTNGLQARQPTQRSSNASRAATCCAIVRFSLSYSLAQPKPSAWRHVSRQQFHGDRWKIQLCRTGRTSWNASTSPPLGGCWATSTSDSRLVCASRMAQRRAHSRHYSTFSSA